MNIPRYWSRARTQVRTPDGRNLNMSAWGWSIVNTDEAHRNAEERLAGLVRRTQVGDDLQKRYAYGRNPLREEILEEIPRGPAGSALVTRNSYGSVILNTEQVMFVDVDLPERPAGSGILGSLFRKPKAPDPEVAALDRIRHVLDLTSGNFRVYRTAAGFRVLATDPLFEPGSVLAEEIMNRMGVDPAYLQLCRFQKSFRARLTPKPWRCGVLPPPGAFPREGQSRELFLEWLNRYDRAGASRATCRFVEESGTGRVHEGVRVILALHDDRTRANEEAPLA